MAVLGLEHTGHHLWEAMYGLLEEQGQMLPFEQPSNGLCTARDGINKGRAQCLTRLTQLVDLAAAWGHDSAKLMQLRQAFRADGQLLLASHAANRSIKANGLALCSYPCGHCGVQGAPHPELFRLVNPCRQPDATLYAAAAEAAKVDLRFVVTTRPALEVLRDDLSENSGFTLRRALLMQSQCRLLLEQLRRLDRRFYVCMAYSAPHMAVADVRNHTGLEITPALATRYHTAPKSKGKLTLMLWQQQLANDNRDFVSAVFRLQSCIHEIDQSCPNAKALPALSSLPSKSA
uniref:Uncharacterized protein n=1 Tax=Calcidiscus leptoporus TaxID=127549 RepID=A0A7S0NZJ8_9EUKA